MVSNSMCKGVKYNAPTMKSGDINMLKCFYVGVRLKGMANEEFNLAIV